MELKGKSLTFDPACVSTRTKVDRFLTSMTLSQSFAKWQCVSKNFSWNHQTFIELTICGNMFGLKRYLHFFPTFQEMILAMMELEPCLVILPYLDCTTTKKGRPFSNKYSMLFRVIWCRAYVYKLWLGDGMPTLVKIFVGHNIQVGG